MQLKYLRKWSRMPWWSTMHLLKQRNKLVHDELYQLIAPHLGNLEFLRDKYRYKKHDGEERKKVEYFLRTFLKQFPEMKFMDIRNMSEYESRDNNLVRLVQYFRHLVEKGMTNESAFEKISGKYDEYLQEKRRNFNIANDLRHTNRARSFMDIYQQQAEYEARLKVDRLRRDTKLEDFLDRYELPEYTKHTKIVNQRVNTPGQEREVENVHTILTEYFEKSKTLLKEYYSEAYTRDRLGNLADADLYYNIRETPKRIKKKARGVLAKLDKYNVSLNYDGSVDWENCTNGHFRSKFENNSWIKYALMQRDLDFSFPHLEHQRNALSQAKREITSARNVFKLEEDKRKQKEFQEMLKKQLSQSEIDKALDFSLKGLSDEQDDQGNVSMEALDAKGIIKGFSHRMDLDGTLVESFEERLIRLETKWFRERMANLDSGVEGLSEEEILKKKNQIVDKVRRTKLKLEKAAFMQGMDNLFEEHSSLTEEELMVESVPLERLVNYYRLPKEERTSSPQDSYEFTQSLMYAKRPEVVEDLYDWADKGKSVQLSPFDTVEYMKKRREENQLKYESAEEKDGVNEMLADEDLLSSSINRKTGVRKSKMHQKKERKTDSNNEMLINFLKKNI